MESNKYVKVVYQTPPIGPEKIILYLTTFDVEEYEKSQRLIPKEEIMTFEYSKDEMSRPSFIVELEKNINVIVKNYYEKNIKELKKAKNRRDNNG